MDTAHQPTDEEAAVNALLGRARLFINDLIAFIEEILGRLGDTPLSRKLARHLTRHALVPAETALRRAVLIIAASLPVPILRPAKPRESAPAPDADTAAAKPKAARPRPPRFNMNEPAPRACAPATDYLPEDMLPRIRVLTDAVLNAPPAPQKPAPPPRDSAAVFCRRFDALYAAFLDMPAEAERWARRRIREMARPGAVQRSLPVPLVLPRLRKSADPDARDLLRELTDTTNTRFCHNTS